MIVVPAHDTELFNQGGKCVNRTIEGYKKLLRESVWKRKIINFGGTWYIVSQISNPGQIASPL